MINKINKEEKGITLIALVITIIVLLILAGIAISMLSGENGILKQAVKSKDQMEKAQAEEIAGLAYSEILMEDRETDNNKIMGEIVKDLKEAGYEVKEESTNQQTITGIEVDQETVEMETTSSPIEVGITLKYNEQGSNKYYIKINGKYYEIILQGNGVEISETETKLDEDNNSENEEVIEVNVSDNNIATVELTKNTEASYTLKITPVEKGQTNITLTVKGTSITKSIGVKITKETIASIVKKNAKDYYGKIVTGYDCSKSDYTWQIYYSDGTNIYITTTDYIKITDCPNGKGGSQITGEGNYEITFSGILNDYAGGTAEITDERVKPWISYINEGMGSTSTMFNMKATAYLLDTNIWTEFQGSNAEYAIGAPTLDMFAASYKDTHPDRYVIFKGDGYLTGYFTSWNDKTPGIPDMDGFIPDEFNSLYIKSDQSKTAYSWLASPGGSNAGGYDILQLVNTGKLSYEWYMNGVDWNDTKHHGGGLRPIVCLQSDVELEKVGTGDSVSYKIK